MLAGQTEKSQERKKNWEIYGNNKCTAIRFKWQLSESKFVFVLIWFWIFHYGLFMNRIQIVHLQIVFMFQIIHIWDMISNQVKIGLFFRQFQFRVFWTNMSSIFQIIRIQIRSNYISSRIDSDRVEIHHIFQSCKISNESDYLIRNNLTSQPKSNRVRFQVKIRLRMLLDLSSLIVAWRGSLFSFLLIKLESFADPMHCEKDATQVDLSLFKFSLFIDRWQHGYGSMCVGYIRLSNKGVLWIYEGLIHALCSKRYKRSIYLFVLFMCIFV